MLTLRLGTPIRIDISEYQSWDLKHWQSLGTGHSWPVGPRSDRFLVKLDPMQVVMIFQHPVLGFNLSHHCCYGSNLVRFYGGTCTRCTCPAKRWRQIAVVNHLRQTSGQKSRQRDDLECNFYYCNMIWGGPDFVVEYHPSSMYLELLYVPAFEPPRLNVKIHSASNPRLVGVYSAPWEVVTFYILRMHACMNYMYWKVIFQSACLVPLLLLLLW